MSIAERDKTEATIWEHVIHPQGKMTVTAARRILKLDFSSDEVARMHDLATRNQAGQSTTLEESELDNYSRVGTMLSILRSRARQVLNQRRVS